MISIDLRGALRAAVFVCVLIISACGEPENGTATSSSSTGRELLQASAEALRSVSSVRYEFEVGGPEARSGWLTGTAMLERRTRLEDALISVRGTVHAQPVLGVMESEFAWASDGTVAWGYEAEGAPVYITQVGRGANTLSATAIYAVVPEFLEPDPYWRELGAENAIQLLPAEEISGRWCDPVRVSYQLGKNFTAETVWWIDRKDRLPRRGLWRAPFTGPQGIVLEIRSLKVGIPIAKADLEPPRQPVAWPESKATVVGERLPKWSLASSAGGRIDANMLLGRVVVLDFWNTWCPVCRSLAPKTRALAKEFESQPVQFLGVNILETDDLIAYWAESGASYPTLLQGEGLGATLDLPWQPGIAVIDRQGVVRYKQLGASGDRTARVRAAILVALSDVDGGN